VHRDRDAVKQVPLTLLDFLHHIHDQCDDPVAARRSDLTVALPRVSPAEDALLDSLHEVFDRTAAAACANVDYHHVLRFITREPHEDLSAGRTGVPIRVMQRAPRNPAFAR